MTYFSLGINELIKENPEFQFPRTLDKLLEYNPSWYYDDVERAVREYDPNFSFIRQEESRELVNKESQVDEVLTLLEGWDRGYYYSGVGYVLDLFRHNVALIPFMANHNIYQALYYLGCSLYSEGFEHRARQIWSILAYDSQGEGWSLRAIEQLSSPHIDKSASIF